MTSIWGLSTLRREDRERHIGEEVEYGKVDRYDQDPDWLRDDGGTYRQDC
jgi:hypothetical protein